MKRAIAALLLAATACSGQAGGDTPAAAARTTTSLSPEAGFRSDIEASITISGPDNEATLNGLLTAAQSGCAALDAVQQMADGDAPNDTPETDAAIVAQGVAALRGPDALGALAERGFDDASIDVVMRTGVARFCPQYLAPVNTYLNG